MELFQRSWCLFKNKRKSGGVYVFHPIYHLCRSINFGQRNLQSCSTVRRHIVGNAGRSGDAIGARLAHSGSKGDNASLRRIIADDFIGSSFDGKLLSKQDVIPSGGGPGGFAGTTPSDTTVRVFGDTGVLMGVINTAGDPQPKQIRVTLVCQKRSQGWQLIAAHLTH